MIIKRGVLVGVVFVLACVHHLPAQPNNPNPGLDRVPPEPINLDIPPEEPLDPELVRQEELAIHAIHNPHAHHAWLVAQNPARAALEQVAAFAILNPQAFRRAFPPHPAQIRAEVIAAHAISNPRFPLPFAP